MPKTAYTTISRLLFIGCLASIVGCTQQQEHSQQTDQNVWSTDFFDDFDHFNVENWQDQRIWVNNETHAYVPDGIYGTREVSNGSLKIRVVNLTPQ